ncbi:MAG: NAD-dependent DNA ligase LigA [Chlamydiia bacterium]|nr:NAD-dependent DNA ligase LigA [Chlamydiia bacterium]
MTLKLHTHREYLELMEELTQHDKRYYDDNRPTISDYEYDRKLHLLIQYEKEHPDQIDPNSPTQRVAEAPTEGFVQKAHKTPMLSLANTYSEKEVEDFIHRVHKLLEKEKVDFCAELKMDGTAISLRYEKGKLLHALTRGNGRMGDDVTANIKTIHAVPLTLKGSFPESVEIRGEVYMSLAIFRALNAAREEEGFEPFANPRNSAAGSLKLLDPGEVTKRKLQIVCYGISEDLSSALTQGELLEQIKTWGLPVSSPKHRAICHDLKEIMHFAEKIHQERDALPFEIDGIVIKVNDLKAHALLGATGKIPRFAVAYKFAPEQAMTKINDIVVQVGRSGVLTPVAELAPVLLAGSTITRATLHNQEEIVRKDLRIGDWVWIEKGGDVIPKVTAVDLKKRARDSKPWHMPEHCPICKAVVIQQEGEVAVRCPNPHCVGQRMRSLLYFASKQAMNIEHLGEKVIEQLVEKGLVSRASDLYLLDEASLLQLDGFKEKSARNLLKSIAASRQCLLSRFIMGLGIKYVGTETAELLAEEFRDLDTLMKAQADDLVAIEGIGEKTALAIADYFHHKDHREEIQRLRTHGVQPQPLKKKMASHPFGGKTFVLTGALAHYTRDKATCCIKERGGHVSGSVSKKTDYVLAGEDPGSKYDKAKKLGIQILSEAEFTQML